MNRGEIRSAVISHLRENATTPVRWTSAEIDRYIDDGYREMAEITGAVVRTDTLTIRAESHFYTLPTDCLYPISIQDAGQDEPIDPVHWLWIDGEDEIWIRTLRQRPEVYAAWGLDEIIFWPAYNADGTVRMTQAIIPGPLASDSATPDLPQEYHGGLVEYAIFRCLLKDADGQQLGRAQRHRAYYMEFLGGLDFWTGRRHPNIRRDMFSQVLRNAN